jgi:hypothetical protein
MRSAVSRNGLRPTEEHGIKKTLNLDRSRHALQIHAYVPDDRNWLTPRFLMTNATPYRKPPH